MNVHLSFDVEVWCDGWDRLDRTFSNNYQRQVFGRSKHGDYALPKTLEILNRHRLTGVFFVEPLFAARFGLEHLDTIVRMIRNAGQDVQLHLHPEWVDEILPPIIPNVREKRQHLCYYSLEEQSALIAFGTKLLGQVGVSNIRAFRAGSFAANRDTFAALHRNGIFIDSSLNHCYAISGSDMRQGHDMRTPSRIDGVSAYPISVFTDGTGCDRPAHVNACSAGEMREALRSAKNAGHGNFVVVSHNFEMLKPNSIKPEWTVVKRFESLCAFLDANRASMPVKTFSGLPNVQAPKSLEIPSARFLSTLRRHWEQLRSRMH